MLFQKDSALDKYISKGQGMNYTTKRIYRIFVSQTPIFGE